MKSSYVIALLITLVAVGWVASGMIEPDGSLRAAEPDLRPPDAVHHEAVPPSVRVRLLHAEQREEALVVLGETEASRRVTVRAETQGRVAAVSVEEGAAVTQGEPLVELTPDDRVERLSQAEAAVARWEDRVKADESLVRRNATSRQNLMESRAELEAARADLAAILLDLDRTHITAPFDGVLETRSVEVGDYVAIGAAVADIVDLDPITVLAMVTEADVGRVHLGQSGTVTLVTGQTVAGTVSFVAKVADGVTRTYAVEVDIPNPDGIIPAGMTAQVRLALDTARVHRISPAVLSLDDAGRVGVKLVDADDQVAFYPVSVAGDDDDGLWIEGLPDPATLIVVGQEFVRPGQVVRPVSEAEIAAHTQALAKADAAALAAGQPTTATLADVVGEEREASAGADAEWGPDKGSPEARP